LGKELRKSIFSIYGFVRCSDEIVDTFHDYNKEKLLDKFEADLKDALNHGISLNPILQSFQLTVNKYGISHDHIDAFMKSMRYDLTKSEYNNHDEIGEYIFGSAEAVGLMCLKVFCYGNEQQFKKLEEPAIKLGSAFQKVNFLRDLKEDTHSLGRKYFPQIENGTFNETVKIEIVADIEKEFNSAYLGIKQLPGRSKLAVLIAYLYYRNLLRKIKRTPAEKIIQTRIRVSNFRKFLLMIYANFVYKLNLV
jgi:phytoene/squalene synthetase